VARQALAGSRIRDRRILLGLRQAELARMVGISPAYLNLIEHNRRRVGDALLDALARQMGVEPSALSEGGDGALFDGLRQAAAEREPGIQPEVDRIEDFAGRFPGWAALLARRQDQVDRLSRTVETLSERMAQDPFLATSLHEVLSAITSVRSTSAILAESDDIDPEWRRRFHRNIHEDSVRLSNVSAGLVAWLDQAHSPESGLSSPQEELESWLQARNWHVAELEQPEIPPLDSLIAGAPELASAAARVLAVEYLAQARADAQCLPLAAFRQVMADESGDPALIAARFGMPMAPVLRRMAALPAELSPPGVGLVGCDGTGTLTFRRPSPGFSLPRFGSACARWPLFDALAQPVTPIRRVLRMAGRGAGSRFVAFAWCDRRHPDGFDGPAVSRATMLILPFSGPPPAAERVVGASCRICSEAGCTARREPSILL
jgi:predicted transcriptional regulator/DNA-binding XRE family transcriptional regulator